MVKLIKVAQYWLLVSGLVFLGATPQNAVYAQSCDKNLYSAPSSAKFYVSVEYQNSPAIGAITDTSIEIYDSTGCLVKSISLDEGYRNPLSVVAKKNLLFVSTTRAIQQFDLSEQFPDVPEEVNLSNSTHISFSDKKHFTFCEKNQLKLINNTDTYALTQPNDSTRCEATYLSTQHAFMVYDKALSVSNATNLSGVKIVSLENVSPTKDLPTFFIPTTLNNLPKLFLVKSGQLFLINPDETAPQAVTQQVNNGKDILAGRFDNGDFFILKKSSSSSVELQLAKYDEKSHKLIVKKSTRVTTSAFHLLTMENYIVVFQINGRPLKFNKTNLTALN